jgi:hypothetical protein
VKPPRGYKPGPAGSRGHEVDDEARNLMRGGRRSSEGRRPPGYYEASKARGRSLAAALKVKGAGVAAERRRGPALKRAGNRRRDRSSPSGEGRSHPAARARGGPSGPSRVRAVADRSPRVEVVLGSLGARAGRRLRGPGGSLERRKPRRAAASSARVRPDGGGTDSQREEGFEAEGVGRDGRLRAGTRRDRERGFGASKGSSVLRGIQATARSRVDVGETAG